MLRTNNRGVAAAFARHQEAVNSNGQFFSTGRVLYSYGSHWPVAVWAEDGLHLNDARYSPTTSKHRSFAIGGLIREGVNLENVIHHNSTQELQALI